MITNFQKFVRNLKYHKFFRHCLDPDNNSVEAAVGFLLDVQIDILQIKSVQKSSPQRKPDIKFYAICIRSLEYLISLTLEGKLIFEKLWELNLEWDSPISIG